MNRPEEDEVRRALEAAAPEDRGAILLAAIAPGPGGPPRLPSGVALDGADLSREGLEGRLGPVSAGAPSPSWISAETGGLDLRGADLRGARLGHAVLRGADLRGANLAGAAMGRADLRGAAMDGADLSGADLAGADLRGARLGEANLDGALLEDADLRGAFLRFARFRGAVLEHADLREADLWSVDLGGADLTRGNLQGVRLQEAGLARVVLANADLRGATVDDCDLRGANLRGADFRGAVLRRADLREADLRDAKLPGVDLSACEIAGVGLCDAWLDRTRMHRDQLGGAAGEERAGDFAAAALAYLALERNFAGLGDPSASSWSYLRRRRMQKRGAARRAREDWAKGRPAAGAGWLARAAGDQLTEWLCDYGESVPRVFGALVGVFLGFALLYGVAGGVVRVTESPGAVAAREVTRHPFDLATFSLMAMSTSGSPVIGLVPRDESIQFLVAVEALLGIGLTGLLGFVVGNRIRR